MKFCSVQGCKYPNFSIDKVTKLPYCRTHQTRRTDYDRRTIIQKAIAKQSRLENKVRSLHNDEDKNKQELWFRVVAAIIRKNPKCWECGEPISEADYRNSSAHIFPKKLFPSIATHPLNFLVLGCRCGCHDKSHRLDTFSKMRVWQSAVTRFTAFEEYITEKHKYLDLFKQYAASTHFK